VTPVQRAVMATVMTLKMEERGKHSYGYYSSKTNQIIKGTGFPSMHVCPENVADSWIALGHTRFASVGAQTSANAHPWRLTNKVNGAELVGMHNGGVANWEGLNKDYDRKFEVDSQHLLQHIVEERDLSELGAYGAIIYHWTKKTPGTEDEDTRVYLGKFNGGVLSIFGFYHPETAEEKKDREGRKASRRVIGVVYASTADACRVALRMAGVAFEDYTEYTVDSGTLYMLDMDPKDPDSSEDSPCMYWYARNDKKGLSLKPYSKEQARAARGGKAYEGWSTNLPPSKRDIREAIDTGFKSSRAWEMVKFFYGLDRYLGREKCRYCSILADFELADTQELFCHNHWVKLIQDGDARVVPIRAVSDALAEVGEVIVPDDDPPLSCDLCENGIAILWDDESKTLGCVECATGEWREGNWQPIEAVMGKGEGDDSRKESDDDFADDYTAPVVEPTNDEKKSSGVVEKAGPTLLKPVPNPLRVVDHKIMCEDCEEVVAQGAYRVIYDMEGVREHSVVSRTFLLCHVCLSVRKINPNKPGVKKAFEIPLKDTSWGQSSQTVN
jgi:hypothetical protein